MTAAAHAENPFAGQGSVLLDIGGDVGALVVTMPSSMVDVEVEIRPVSTEHALQHEEDGHHHHPHAEHGHGHHRDGEHGHHHHPHVAVVERPVGDGVVPSLVFPELVEGSYELYVKETDDVRLTVDVTGGVVTDAAWPD